MFIDKDDFKYRIESEDNLLREDSVGDAVRKLSVGGQGNPIPIAMREAISIAAKVGGESIRTIAKEVGIDKNTVFGFKHGIVNKDENGLASKILKDGIEEQLKGIRNKAINRVTKALECISDEDLENAGPATLAMIASNLSRVVSSTLPKNDDGGKVNNNFQTIFYSPQTKEIDSFPVIEVNNG